MSAESKRFSAILAHRTTNEQLLQVCEELGELVVSISQRLRGRIDNEQVAIEIADVELQIEWLQHLFGISDTQLNEARKHQRAKFRRIADTQYGYKAEKSTKKFKETGMTRSEVLRSRTRAAQSPQLRKISGEENIVRDADGLPVALYLSPRRT